MLRYILATSLLAFALGCGSDVYDESRVPEDAPDTSDPMDVQMGEMPDGAPRGAQTGPPSE